MAGINCKVKSLYRHFFTIDDMKNGMHLHLLDAKCSTTTTWFSWNAKFFECDGACKQKKKQIVFCVAAVAEAKENGKSIAKHYFAYRIIHIRMEMDEGKNPTDQPTICILHITLICVFA